MKGYAETEVFDEREFEAWRIASLLVGRIDDLPESELGWIEQVRCHELARAVARVLDDVRTLDAGVAKVEVVDGKYGAVNHSWLVFTESFARGHILDVYAVGRVPMVQIVDAELLLPEARSYKASSLAAIGVEVNRVAEMALVRALTNVALPLGLVGCGACSPCASCVTCSCCETPMCDKEGLCLACGGQPLALAERWGVPHVGVDLDDDVRTKVLRMLAQHA